MHQKNALRTHTLRADARSAFRMTPDSENLAGGGGFQVEGFAEAQLP